MTAMRRLLLTLLLLLSHSIHAFVTPQKRFSHESARFLMDFFNKNKEAEVPTATDEPEEEFQDGAYDADDPVEKIFSFFFGKREEAPLGLCK